MQTCTHSHTVFIARILVYNCWLEGSLTSGTVSPFSCQSLCLAGCGEKRGQLASNRDAYTMTSSETKGDVETSLLQALNAAVYSKKPSLCVLFKYVLELQLSHRCSVYISSIRRI